MSEPKTYTASDVERYHRGEMPPAEMHLLERAALDDPFLADMLEGYRFTSSAAADLQSLQNRLQQRLDKDEQRSTPVIWGPWLKAAAILIVVAGGGWLAIQMLSTKNGNIASQNTVAEKQAAVPARDSGGSPALATAPAQKADSVPAANAVAVNTTKPRKKQIAEADKALPAPAGATSGATAMNEASQAADAGNFTKLDEQRTDSGRGVMALRARKAAPAVSASSDTVKDLTIVLKPLDQSYTEVTVSSGKAKEQQSKKPAVSVDTLEPEQGWNSFQEYVAENLKAPEERREKRAAEGEVELSFSVDKEGNPTNIKVTKSLCAKCDTEAIRLLKEGPKWKGKKGKVKIRFPL